MKKILVFALVLSLLLSVSANAAGELPLTTNGDKLTIGLQQSATVISYEDNKMTDWLEEKTGVNIEFMIFPADGGEASTKMELMVSSGAVLPDIIFDCGISNYTTLQRYADAGKLVALDDYWDEYAYYLPSFVERQSVIKPYLTMEDYLTYGRGTDGHSYAFCQFSYAEQNCWNRRSWINDAWLQQLGLDMPQTTEELEAALTAFVENDMNGNGVKDELGVVGYADNNGIAVLMNMFCYVSDTANGYYYYLEDGQIMPQFTTDSWRHGLSVLHDWVDKGIYSTISFSQDKASQAAIGSSDPMTAGMVVYNTGSAIASNRVNYLALGIVESEDGVGYATYSPSVPYPVAVITSDCADPVLAFRFLDFFAGKDCCYINRYGIEGENWEWLPEGSQVKTAYFDINGSYAEMNLLEDVWGTQQKINWAQTGPWMSCGSFAGTSMDRDSNSYLNFAHYSSIYDTLPRMDGLYYDIIVYTNDEIDEWAETRSALKTYINEQATYFVLGTLDINDDKAWNNYLSDLEKIGYKDLIAADQVALNRTLGK